MALNKLKKWIGTQAMTAFFDQLNDNVDATNAAIDLAEQNATQLAESANKHIHSSGSNYIRFDDGTQICYMRGIRATGNGSALINLSVPLPANFVNSSYTVTVTPTGRFLVPGGEGMSTKYFNAMAVTLNPNAINTLRFVYGDGSVLEATYEFEVNLVAIGRWK